MPRRDLHICNEGGNIVGDFYLVYKGKGYAKYTSRKYYLCRKYYEKKNQEQIKLERVW